MRFKKIRKIFRIIFPLEKSQESVFENKLRSNELLSDFEKENDGYKIKVKDNFELFIRDGTHSDLKVFEQIFNNLEYNAVLQLLILNPIFSEQKIIIDAGANIGCTSIFFSNNLPNATIIAVEPSPKNFKVLEKNIQLSNNTTNFITYNRALTETVRKFFKLEREFGDGTNWAITTAEDITGQISGITINEIVKEQQLDFISLLKIDIEGAERFLFKQGNDFSFLGITQLIAVEIHNEFKIRTMILDVLRQHGFIVFDTNETTIGINKSIIK
jgi:FkbM family methyltransferase